MCFLGVKIELFSQRLSILLGGNIRRVAVAVYKRVLLNDRKIKRLFFLIIKKFNKLTNFEIINYIGVTKFINYVPLMDSINLKL